MMSFIMFMFYCVNKIDLKKQQHGTDLDYTQQNCPFIQLQRVLALLIILTISNYQTSHKAGFATNAFVSIMNKRKILMWNRFWTYFCCV